MARVFTKIKKILLPHSWAKDQDTKEDPGYENSNQHIYPKDMDAEFFPIYHNCKNFTMTSIERCYALYKAIEYIHEREIPGEIVECGVWKGGSAMICALSLLHFGEMNRDIYLYDTFTGMVEPSPRDISLNGEIALDTYHELITHEYNNWCYAPFDEVSKNILSTGYPIEKIKLIKGKVEDTIPKYSPSKIAILRMDTDWYSSTFHQFTHLYPLVPKGGVVIIDDYGYWQGCKEATDDYFRQRGDFILLNRIDDGGRIGVKIECPILKKSFYSMKIRINP